MHIVNIWGMWFLFAMPLLISIVLVHIEGVEEGKKINESRKRRIK